MGLGPSRLTYDMPPPPPLAPNKDDLDLSADAPLLADRQIDPEGYKMCYGVAVKEGILAATAAMSLTGLAIIGAKRRLSTLKPLPTVPPYFPPPSSPRLTPEKH